MVVEFLASDVQADGTIQLALLGADGQFMWEQSVSVTAGPRVYARFTVPDLQLGGVYHFRVSDEPGQWRDASGVTVGAFVADLVAATTGDITLSFSSLPDHDYEIQWVELLGDTWQPVDTVTASGNETTVVVPHPDPEDSSGFFRVELK